MTRDEVIRLAREAGATEWCPGWHCATEELERFAALVAAHEREACAKVCDEVFAQWQNCEPGDEDLFGAEECAAAIRARGNDELP